MVCRVKSQAKGAVVVLVFHREETKRRRAKGRKSTGKSTERSSSKEQTKRRRKKQAVVAVGSGARAGLGVGWSGWPGAHNGFCVSNRDHRPPLRCRARTLARTSGAGAFVSDAAGAGAVDRRVRQSKRVRGVSTTWSYVWSNYMGLRGR